MNNLISILTHTQLFNGMTDEEILSVTKCLNANVRSYKKGEFVLRQGEPVYNIMVLTAGRLHI